MRTYRLEVPTLTTVMLFIMLSIFTVVCLLLLGAAVVTSQLEMLAPGLFLLVIVSIWWWFVTGTTYRIEVAGMEDIRFVSMRRTIRTSASLITSLELGGSSQYGQYVLRHSEGKFGLLIYFTGFYELLHEIKQTNPSFQTKWI